MLKKIFFLSFILPISANSYYEDALKTKLFETYDNDVFPSGNNSKIDLKMGIAFRAFNNIDQIEGTLTSNIWLRHWWIDELLKWNPGDYGNITSLVLLTDPEKGRAIWTPDIYLYNTAEQPLSQLDYSHVSVSYNGYILWSRPGIVVSTCFFDLKDFPYDQQICELKFGSWSYHGEQLNLILDNNSIDISNYQENEGWDLIEHKSTLNTQVYSCCPEPYQDATFEITLRRKPGYYVYNIIFPTFATASLMIFSMLIPWDQGERISFAVTVMLSIIVFLLILSENLPKTDTQPLLSRMLIGLTMFSLLVVLLTVIMGFMHSYKDKKIHFIKNIIRFFKCQKPIDCMGNNENRNNDENNNLDKDSIYSIQSNNEEIYVVNDSNNNFNINDRTTNYSITNNTPNNNEYCVNSCQEMTNKMNDNLEKIVKNTNPEEESEYEKCNLIAEYCERGLTLTFVASFVGFCAVLFSERPDYSK